MNKVIVEYRSEPMPRTGPKAFLALLTKLGEDGWELCMADYGHAFFRRKVMAPSRRSLNGGYVGARNG